MATTTFLSLDLTVLSSYAILHHMNQLTERQQEILQTIIDYIAQHGFPPTHRELAALVSIKTTRGIETQLHALEKKGYIKQHHVARGIQVLRRPDD